MKPTAQVLFALTLFAGVPATAQPLGGVTHVALKVSDLERSLAFYSKLGFEQAFRFDDHGRTTVAFVKISDRQFLEIWPRAKADEPTGLFHVCFESANVKALREEYAGRGIGASEVAKARAGNLLFHVPGPDGRPLEFLEYLPESLHSQDRGKHLGAGRASTWLQAVGVPLKEQAPYEELLGKLGFERGGAGRWRVPGNSGHELRTRVGQPGILTFRVDEAKAARSLKDPDGTVVEFALAPKAAPWTAVADRLIETPVDSYPFNWGEGVQMMGLMKAAMAARDSRYADYVEKWAAIWEPMDRGLLLNTREPISEKTRRGYCGHWSPASAILYLYSERKKPEHLKLARDVADFIAKGAERSPDGALGHWQGSHQLWVDTLFMACPLLAELGRLEKRPELIEDSAHQIVEHVRRVQDPATGLIYHMWDWQTGTRSEGYWGRGNGWVLMSIADTMEVMPRGHARYRELSSIASKLAEGILATQNGAGLWHTILDDPASYEEVSATAMFAYGLLKLSRLGVLPASVRPAAMRGWRAINERFVKDGLVMGVSAGTDPKGRDAYRTIALGRQTWGTGAYLLAASEISRRGK